MRREDSVVQRSAYRGTPLGVPMLILGVGLIVLLASCDHGTTTSPVIGGTLPSPKGSPTVTAKELTPSVEQFTLVSYRRIDENPRDRGTPIYIVNQEVILRAQVRGIKQIKVLVTRSATETVAAVTGVPDANGNVQVSVRLPKVEEIYVLQVRAVTLDEKPVFPRVGFRVKAEP